MSEQQAPELSEQQRKLLKLLKKGAQLAKIPHTSYDWVVVIARPPSDIDTHIDPLQVWKLPIEVLGQFSGWEIEPLRKLGYISDSNRITAEGIKILDPNAFHSIAFPMAHLGVMSEDRRANRHVNPKDWTYQECLFLTLSDRII